MTRDRVNDVYPRYEEFSNIRRELDPQGIFMNDHTCPLFG
jgi:hypothetical protein